MSKLNTQFKKLLALFLIGGASYVCIELLWRGHSHWTMFILGGLCFVLIGGLNNYIPWSWGIIMQQAAATGIVTILEDLTGRLVNDRLGWNIWNYDTLFGNIDGNICLEYIALWFFLSIPAIFIDDWLRYKLFNEEKPHYTFL